MSKFLKKLKGGFRTLLTWLLDKRKAKAFLKIDFILFPFLWTLTFFFSVLESFTYAGFLFKHIFLPFQFFLIWSIFSGILARLTPQEEKIVKMFGDYHRVLSIFAQLTFLPLLITTGIIVSIEMAHYPNYVFSLVHLQPKLLFWPCFLSTFLAILGLEDLARKEFLGRVFLGGKRFQQVPITEIFKRIVVFGLIFWLFANNLFGISGGMIKKLSFMVGHPLASYDEKMYKKWGRFYNYMVFIQKNTPPNATIMFPPQAFPWMSVGNGGLIRYFLYPREIIHHKEDPYGDIMTSADFVMIAWGYWSCKDREGKPCHGWPKVEIPAEWITYKQEDSMEIEKKLENTVYNPDDDINHEAWGLIRIRKE